MRIAFVNSSLEHGRDGVGDYTRDLAAACQLAGHSCAILALNDRHIDCPREESQVSRGLSLECLRLPAAGDLELHLTRAEAWLDQYEPDVISLQFVAYGFHPKGLIGNLGNSLASLFGARPVHLMLHELWIGTESSASLRHRFVGSLQRHAILSLIRRLNPRMIHTSNAAYANLLSRRGIRVKLLQLCGSVPLAADPDVEWLGRELQKLGVPLERAQSRDKTWRFGLFGSLYSAWSPEPLFSHIASAADRANRQVVVAAIGRQGPGISLWQQIQRRYEQRFSIVALGERTPRELSTFFQTIDFGVGVTPWQIIGKSSSVAAMIEHGLPIIVASHDNDYGSKDLSTESPLLHRMDANTPQWLANARRQPPRIRLPEMAAQFIADMEAPSADLTQEVSLAQLDSAVAQDAVSGRAMKVGVR